MRVITAIVLVCSVVLIAGRVECRSVKAEIVSLIGQDSLAQKARLHLAKYLYEEGVRQERSGNFAGAVRLWLSARNMDSSNGVILKRLEDAYKTLIRASYRKYKEALVDLQYGRKERALSNLRLAGAMGDGIDSELEDKIKAAEEKIARSN